MLHICACKAVPSPPSQQGASHGNWTSSTSNSFLAEKEFTNKRRLLQNHSPDSDHLKKSLFPSYFSKKAENTFNPAVPSILAVTEKKWTELRSTASSHPQHELPAPRQGQGTTTSARAAWLSPSLAALCRSSRSSQHCFHQSKQGHGAAHPQLWDTLSSPKPHTEGLLMGSTLAMGHIMPPLCPHLPAAM